MIQSNLSLAPVLFVMIVLSCQVQPESTSLIPEAYHSCISPDTIISVREWAMSSSEGLWEDSLQYMVFVNDGEPIPLNSTLEAQSIYPKTFSINEEKIVIFDQYQHSLAYCDLNGSIEWEYGEDGEGPEHYCGNMEGRVNDYGISIRDSALSKLDIISHDGELLNSEVLTGVQYGCALPNGSFCTISSWTSSGIFSIYNSSGELESTFGDDTAMYEQPSMPYYRFAILDKEGILLATASYKDDYLCLANLSEGSISFHQREKPFDVPTYDRVVDNNGAAAGIRLYPNINALFTGPDDMINIQVLIPNLDGNCVSALGLYDRDYTLIDRYNWYGEYLESYIIPMGSIGSLCYSNGSYYALRYEDGLIYKFSVVH